MYRYYLADDKEVMRLGQLTNIYGCIFISTGPIKTKLEYIVYQHALALKSQPLNNVRRRF